MLPHADEIRELRTQVDDARDALMDLQRIQAAATTLEIVEEQLRRGTAWEGMAPGQTVVDALAERWPMLVDLRAGNPSPQLEPSAALLARRSQLQFAKQVLQPLSGELEELGARMHALQHAQRHALEAPEYAADVLELTALGNEREDLSRRLRPLEQKLGMVEPADKALRSFRQQLQGAFHQEGPLAAFRAVLIADSLVTAMADMLATLELEVVLPVVPDDPSPSPEHEEANRAAVATVLEELGKLGDVISRQAMVLSMRRENLAGELEVVVARITDRMG